MKKPVIFLMALLLSVAVPAQKVGLVLSGGGARGLTHIGIIHALEDNGIPIDYVAGTSMGAVVASLYAMGYSPREMVDFISSPDFYDAYTGSQTDIEGQLRMAEQLIRKSKEQEPDEHQIADREPDHRDPHMETRVILFIIFTDLNILLPAALFVQCHARH